METTLIIPSEYRDQINEALTPRFGPNNFSIPIDNGGPVTHYGCSWRMSETDRAAVQAVIDSIVPVEAEVIVDNTQRFDEVLVENELTKSDL